MATSKGRKQRRQTRPGPRRSPPYEFLDHPADVGFRARGRSLRELFANAARALLDYGWDLKTVRARQRVTLRAAGHDRESLLYNWLSEILSRADAEGWAFKRVTVNRFNEERETAEGQGTTYEVQGTARGERFLRGRHRARTYIKAVTYHQLAVRKTRDAWRATVYLDV